MGSHRYYNPDGGFSEYLYRKEGETTYINGLRVEVISMIDDENHHAGLPFYSNTSDVYLKIIDDGDWVEKAIVYENRKAVLEFDWGHPHKGRSGSPSFEAGMVHVHELHEVDGVVVRKKQQPRYMNNEEMAKYGDVIRYANPNAKMR